jgi:hypothetical protein
MILLIVIVIIITINVIDIGFDEAGIASETSVKNMDIVMPLQDEKTGPSSSWKEREVTWKDVTDGLDILCLIVSYALVK